MRELSLNVMDIAQNSIVAGASLLEIGLCENTAEHILSITINDNGSGMDEDALKSVTNPFYTKRTTRKVGLGVPLFKMACEQTGGSFFIDSHLGKGTSITAVFKTDSVDFTPIGDMVETVGLLISCNPNMDVVYTHRRDEGELTLDTRELREILGGDVALDTPDVSLWIKDYLKEQTALLYGGETN